MGVGGELKNDLKFSYYEKIKTVPNFSLRVWIQFNFLE